MTARRQLRECARMRRAAPQPQHRPPPPFCRRTEPMSALQVDIDTEHGGPNKHHGIHG